MKHLIHISKYLKKNFRICHSFKQIKAINARINISFTLRLKDKKSITIQNQLCTILILSPCGDWFQIFSTNISHFIFYSKKKEIHCQCFLLTKSLIFQKKNVSALFENFLFLQFPDLLSVNHVKRKYKLW